MYLPNVLLDAASTVVNGAGASGSSTSSSGGF